MKLIYLLFAFFLTSYAQANENKETVIHGIQVEMNKLRVLVTSTGCTTQASFQLTWQNDSLLLVKVKPDHCRRLAHQVWIEFNLPKEHSVIYLLNPISP